jgi:hypothetical protein
MVEVEGWLKDEVRKNVKFFAIVVTVPIDEERPSAYCAK